jgi:hypothetical protein
MNQFDSIIKRHGLTRLDVSGRISWIKRESFKFYRLDTPTEFRNGWFAISYYDKEGIIFSQEWLIQKHCINLKYVHYHRGLDCNVADLVRSHKVFCEEMAIEEEIREWVNDD